MLTASDTAYAIATIRALETELPEGERLFADPYARVFADAGAHAKEGTERFLGLPFFRDGIRLRTRHIDDVVRGEIERGTRQLVLMGAGFDARALRLPEVTLRGMQVFEVDMPGVLETKRSLLERAGSGVPGWVHSLACDFREDYEASLERELIASGFDRGRPALFVWEGVIAYIGVAAIEKGMRFMASIGASGSRLIFDFSEYVFNDVPAAELARRAGFAVFEEVRFDELWRRHLPGDPSLAAAVVRLGIASKQ